MRIGRRVVKALIWGVVLCLSILGGGLWFAYWYMTDGDTVAQLIRERAVRYFPRSTLDPGRVRISLYGGEAVFRQLRMFQKIDGAPLELLRIPWLSIRINTRKLAKGQFEAREVVVSQPTLRLRRRRDGAWNLEGLLADPWPGPWIETPPITIQNATLELIPDDEPEYAAGGQDASKTSLAPGARMIPVSGTGAEVGVSPPPKLLPASVGGVVNRSPAILRDVALKIEQAEGGHEHLKFEGTARGDAFEKMRLKGTVNLMTGSITLEGELAGLTLSENLRRRVPREARPVVKALALNSGVVDIELKRFRIDPTAAAARRLSYHAQARLRDGVWECPKLPFPVNELSADIGVEDGILSIKRAQGSNGLTILRADGTIGLLDPEHSPLDLRIDLTDLELDQRLRDHTPEKYDELWDVFKPRGRVKAELHLVRGQTGEPVDLSAKVYCRDVAAVYRHFQYPLDHLTGELTLEKKLLSVDLETLKGGQPVRLKGTIKNPGVDAVVKLDIQAESIPIDDVLKNAMPPDVRKVVNQFNPSGVVKAHASVFREPLLDRRARPEGLIKIDAEIDLTERCEITWEGLPYPIRNLTGRLEIHPDHWVFTKMRGSNGKAKIKASGSVEKLDEGRVPPSLARSNDPLKMLKIDVKLEAQDLPFSGELKDALPAAWKKSWPTINPSGSCDVEAEVHVAPGQPDHTHIVIMPQRESNVRLEVTRTPQPGIDPGGTIELPMENVRGRFVFDDGEVAMNDVNFKFRGAPVTFSHGKVFLEDSGRFDLVVNDLDVKDIRVDDDLRKKMPRLMAQFALRLDDGHAFRARGDLQIYWTGERDVPAWCKWKNTLVVFDGNAVKTGIPLEHIYGRLKSVSGASNGQMLDVEGILQLDSVSLLGQQITAVESPFHIKEGVARLDNVQGHFLKGELVGENCWVTLDATPRYHAALSIRGARLQEYALTIPGRQSYRGNINAGIELNGWGSDVRNLHGGGDAHITEGYLGELPALFKLATMVATTLNLPGLALTGRARGAGKTPFDSADVVFTIAHGLTTFDPIKFTGNAFSLQGQGTMNPQGNLDLQLNVLWGRDQLHIPLLSDLTREASTPILIVKVEGTPSYPQYGITPLPLVNKVLQALSRSRAERQGP
jgi:AsmA-like C-terminal region